MACLSPEQLEKLNPDTKLLEVGCGQKRRWENSVTLDVNPRTVADVIQDLNIVPYPFPDNHFDIVIAEHILEHLNNVVQVVEELYRILKPGGILYVEVPHFSNSGFFTDPTHVHAFSTRSFDYFVPGTKLHEYNYSHATFKKRHVTLDINAQNPIKRAWGKWINQNHEYYERRLAFIFPKQTINYELEAIK